MTDTPDAADARTPGVALDSSDTGPDEEREPRRRSRLVVALVATGLAVALVVLIGARILGWWPAEEEPVAEPTGTPAPTESVSPFTGTPAEDFAEGADGIVLPEVEPVGDFTAEEVAEALEQVRRALIAARLDHTMLIDHDPDEFLALLAPDHQPGRAAEFDTGDFHAYATMMAEDTALAPATPRVHGEISYDATTVEGDLPAIEILTSFVWVYAVEAAGGESSRLVVIRDEARWEVVTDERWLESSRGLWLAEPRATAWGADCPAYDEGLLQPQAESPADLGGEQDAIFDLGEPLDAGDPC